MTTTPSPPSRRILSGVQPSGKLHLGNYFGAIRQHIALQDEGECFYFIADYHALTTIQDRGRRCASTRRRRPRLPGPRTRSGQGRLLPPVRRARSLRAGLDPQHRDQHGPAGTGRVVQGKGRQGHRGQRRPVHLSDPDGGRHPHLSLAPGAGRQGPGAAPGDDPRHRRASSTSASARSFPSRITASTRSRRCPAPTARR